MDSFLQLLDENFKDINILIDRLYELDKVTGVTVKKNIMKSTIIMILYNIIESMLTQLLDYLHDILSQEKFSSCRKEIQLIYLKYYIDELKQKNLKILNKFIFDSIKIPSFLDFNRKYNIFSGNVDLRKIKEILKIYGITVFKKDFKDETLLMIKNKRNALAHGEIQYHQACRDYTVAEIEKKTKITKDILIKLIKGIDHYITKQLYLKK